jgi:hypothetical protein
VIYIYGITESKGGKYWIFAGTQPINVYGGDRIKDVFFIGAPITCRVKFLWGLSINLE